MSEIFQFMSSASLERLTGRKAQTLEGLLELIKTCPDSSIFFHTFSAFLKFREVKVPFNNDFAIWVSTHLNEKALAEKLMAIDLSEYNSIGSLKARLIEIIESYKVEKPDAFKKTANEAFYLHDINRIVYLTDKFAYDLTSFRDVLSRISHYSLYFHLIESRLHFHLQDDDFSIWIEERLNLPELARKIRKIDISVHTLEGLRYRIIQLIDEHLKGQGQKGIG